MFTRIGSSMFNRARAVAVAAGISLGGMTSVAMASGGDFPHQAWNHRGFAEKYDSNALRRGFEVYRQVCSTCHSLEFLAYRELIGVTHTEEQAKAIARTVEVTDGPNDTGAMYTRPGKLFDYYPSPYANEEEARFANGGAAPPDLSLIVTARPGEENYIFSLLTGYDQPPAGMTLREGLHYNAYFPGNAISMPAPLTDGQVEYEDGTPATVSQMAKDVTTFLTWSSMPEQDERKLSGLRGCAALFFGLLFAGYTKRFHWASLKTRRISYPRGDAKY